MSTKVTRLFIHTSILCETFTGKPEDINVQYFTKKVENIVNSI